MQALARDKLVFIQAGGNNPDRLKPFSDSLWCSIGVMLMSSPAVIAAKLNAVIVVGRV